MHTAYPECKYKRQSWFQWLFTDKRSDHEGDVVLWLGDDGRTLNRAHVHASGRIQSEVDTPGLAEDGMQHGRPMRSVEQDVNTKACYLMPTATSTPSDPRFRRILKPTVPLVLQQQ